MSNLNSYINVNSNTVSTVGNISTLENVSATGNVTGNYILGDGSLLSNVTVSGGTPVSTTGNVSGGNLIATGTVSASGNITAGNIIATNVGNIAALNLNGNANTVLYGNGVFAAAAASSSYGNANVVANLAALGSNPVSTTGNITAGYLLGNGSQLTGIVSSYGNSNVTALLAALGSNTISTTGTITSGNITSGNILTAGQVSATGNATFNAVSLTGTSGNITGADQVLANAFSASGNVTASGLTVFGSAIITGNTTVQGTLTYNNLTNITTPNLVFGLANTSTGISANGAGFVVGNTNQASFLYNYGTSAWNSNIAISAVGNLTGGNVLTGGIISSAGNITGGNISATNHTGTTVSVTGNITGAYIIGNGSQLTGVTAYTNANTAAFLAAFGSNTISTTGTISSGNITGGNVLTGGIVSATGNITGGNISATNHTGTTVSVSGNVTGGNVLTGGLISSTGNITGGNLSVTNIVGTLTTAAQNNITSVGTLSSLSVTATVTGGNVATAGTASATGNITGGNILSGGLISTTGNAIHGNILTGGIVSATGNITGGNILTAGQVSATGNVTTTNYFVGNLVGTSASMTGNVYAGNVIVNGQPTTYGIVNPGYVNVGLTNAITGVGSGSTLIYDATLKSNGTAVTYNTGTGVFTLTAGVTYNLMATGSWSNFSDTTNGYIVYAWVDATTGTRLDTTGNSDGIAEPINRPVNEFNATAAELIYTPVTNQTVKVNVVAAGGTVAMRGGIGSKAIVTQINPTIAVQATATGTVNAVYGNVTLAGGYSQVVAATSPGTTIFTLPTLQPGTYLITATAKVTGSYCSMGIFTGGSQVANSSVFNWYQGSGTVNFGMNGTWVITVNTPAVYTINAWGGGTVTVANDGAGVANYIKIDSTFALNTLGTMTTTGNVSVGGNLTVTGSSKGPTPDWTLGDSASATYFLLGTWNTSNAGNTLYMRMVAHTGYNAVAIENQVTELMFATSNGSAYIAGSSGNYYANGLASVNSRLGTGGTSPSYKAPQTFRIVQVSQTQYQVYCYFAGAYMRNSTYSIQISSGDTWTDGGGSAVSAPGGNYITITPSSF